MIEYAVAGCFLALGLLIRTGLRRRKMSISYAIPYHVWRFLRRYGYEALSGEIFCEWPGSLTQSRRNMPVFAYLRYCFSCGGLLVGMGLRSRNLFIHTLVLYIWYDIIPHTIYIYIFFFMKSLLR